MPRKKKTPKLDTIEKTDWDNILSEIDKSEIPIELLELVLINLVSGDTIEIDVQRLVETGVSPLEIERKLNEKLISMSDIIKDVDFHIVREKVIKVVRSTTSELLKKQGE